VSAGARPPYRSSVAQGAKQPARPGPAGNADRLRNYFRVIAGVDDNLGRILKTLDELNLADNTVVIYTSDNGFYLGEHGLGDKRSAYDESMRIPFLVRYPRLGVKGKTVDEMVLNIDVATTLLDFAGLTVPSEMQGRSWRPLLTGNRGEWRQAFFYEYFFERNFATPTVLAVRTASAKLIKYPGHDDWSELFDLQADPYEMKNQANDPAHKKLREAMEEEFAKQQKAAGFKVPDYADKPGGENK
jgi:arylsulfatase A-like enzyme